MQYHLKQSTPWALLLIMPTSTETVIGFVLPVNATNSILAAGQIVKTTLEHIFHVCPDHGCVAPAILVMCLMWSSTMIESAAAFFEI